MSTSIETLQTQVSKLYIAFFGRAPEAFGFFYWTQALTKGAPVSAIAESFSKSSEFVSQYGSLTPEDQVARFYQNVLDRPADKEGLAFWTGKLNEGLAFYDIAYSIINTAFQGGTGVNPLDQALVQNKVTVAEYVAVTLATHSAQLATVAFEGVTAEPASVQAAFARLLALTQPAPAQDDNDSNDGVGDVGGGGGGGGGGSGDTDVIRITAQNANLTTDPNTLQNATVVTTAGDDSIETPFAFLAGTTIDGGGGTDTLGVTEGGVFTLNNITNVEVLDLTGANAASTVTQMGTGFNRVDLSNQGDTVTATDVQDLDINGGAGDDTVIYTALADLFNTGFDPAIIRADLNGGGGTDTIQVNSAISTANALNFNRAVSFERLVQNDTGSANITVSIAQDLQEIDISASTANSSVDFTAVTTNMTVVGGSGADTISGGDGDDPIQGNAGADTLTGGLGANRFVYNINLLENTSDSAPGSADVITDFDVTKDVIEIKAVGVSKFLGVASSFVEAVKGNSYEYRLLLDDDAVLGDLTQQIALELQSALTSDEAAAITELRITGTAGPDNVAGGGRSDQFLMLAGNDTVTADENDMIDGGDGQDMVILKTAVDSAHFTDPDLVNVETILLEGNLSAGVDLSAQTEVLSVIGDNNDDTVLLSSGGGTFRGELGKDIATAGLSADTFIIHTVANVGTETQLNESALGSFDVINGFDVDQDRLQIVATNVSVFSIDQVIGGASTELVSDGMAPNIDEIIWVDINASEKLIAGGGANIEGGDVFVYVPGLSLTSAQAQALMQLNLTGTSGDDIISTGALNDVIDGGQGNDTITGGAGADDMNGGAGDDVYQFAESATVGDRIEDASGYDRIVALGPLNLYQLNAGAALTMIEEITVDPGSSFQMVGSQVDGLAINLNQVDTDSAVVDVFAQNTDVDLSNFTFNANGQAVFTSSAGSTVRLIGAEGNETLTGTSHHDDISGDAGDDLIIGGAGADTLDGGLGVDRVAYRDITSSSSHGVSNIAGMAINLSTATVSAEEIAISIGSTVVLGGGAGAAGPDLVAGSAGYLATTAGNSTTTMVRDSLSNFEEVGGSDLDDYIVLGDLGMFVQGLAGADSIIGGAGHDELRGGYGDDVISGGDGDDTLRGGGGDDLINAGAGTNAVERAGIGADTITHDSTGSTVDIVLTASTTMTLNASELGATVTIGGSSLDSDRSVDAASSTAAFTIHGSSLNGNATYVGGSGADTITGGAGADSIDGGGGIDTVSYVDSDAAVDVRLDATPGTGGHAQGDVLRNIEVLIGSGFDDTLFGNGVASTLVGGLGADELDGGFSGVHTYRYETVADSAAAVSGTVRTFDLIPFFDRTGVQADFIDLSAINPTLTGGVKATAINVVDSTVGGTEFYAFNDFSEVADFFNSDSQTLQASNSTALQAIYFEVDPLSPIKGHYLFINNNDTSYSGDDVLIKLSDNVSHDGDVSPVTANFVL